MTQCFAASWADWRSCVMFVEEALALGVVWNSLNLCEEKEDTRDWEEVSFT